MSTTGGRWTGLRSASASTVGRLSVAVGHDRCGRLPFVAWVVMAASESDEFLGSWIVTEK